MSIQSFVVSFSILRDAVCSCNAVMTLIQKDRTHGIDITTNTRMCKLVTVYIIIIKAFINESAY